MGTTLKPDAAAFIETIERKRRLSLASKGVYRLDTEHGVVIIYPPGRWSHKGRNFEGAAEDFLAWLRRL